MKKFLLLAFFLLCFIHVGAQIISTVAGGDSLGLGDGGPAIDAVIAGPIGIAIDGAGNIYIGDKGNNRIRKVNSSGIISTIAGTGAPGYLGDGAAATAALINQPYGVAVDNAGNVYFADGNNNCIRKINTTGVIFTIAGIGGSHGYNGDNIAATTALLYAPCGITVDSTGNILFTDGENNRIRKINTSGIITTIAGTGTAGNMGDNGQATAAEINTPYSILLDAAGNLYIGEQYGGRVRKISSTGIITTFAGTGTAGAIGDNGPATAAEITHAEGLAMDAGGNLYISDEYNERIRKVNASGTITTYAGDGIGDYNGDDIVASAAQLDPAGLALDAIGNLYIADFGNHRIRRITSTVVSVNNVNNVAEYALVYPNPTQRDFTIGITSAFDEQANVVITNTAGEQVKEFTTTTNKPLNVKLDERTGMYFITVTTAHYTECKKLLVANP